MEAATATVGAVAAGTGLAEREAALSEAGRAAGALVEGRVARWGGGLEEDATAVAAEAPAQSTAATTATGARSAAGRAAAARVAAATAPAGAVKAAANAEVRAVRRADVPGATAEVGRAEAGMALENKIIELTGEINTLKRFRV